MENFKLTLKVKLTPNAANSGIQFRSEPLPDGEMKGPQADIGAGWWGKLYEESGRGLARARRAARSTSSPTSGTTTSSRRSAAT